MLGIEALIWGDEEIASADRGFREWLLPRGSTIAKHEASPTYLFGVSSEDGIVLDGASPILSFPYAWSLAHGFGGPVAQGTDGFLEWLEKLVTSAEPED